MVWLGVKGYVGFMVVVIVYQLEVEWYDISGCFKFLWIFGWEGVGMYCGVCIVWVNVVDVQVLLIFIGQYLYYFFGGKF